jgi:hypothetical protein
MRLDGKNTGKNRKRDKRKKKPRTRADRTEERRRSVRRVGRLLGMLAFVVGLFFVMTAGRAPLPARSGEPAPETLAARVSFVDQTGRTVQAGQVIVRGGEPVDTADLARLRAERTAYRQSDAGFMQHTQERGALGVALLVVFAGAVAYTERYRESLLSKRSAAFAFALFTLAVAAFARYCVVAGVSPLWVPMPFVIIAMCLVFDQRFGLASAVFYALLVRLACPGANYEFFVLLVGGLAAALLSRKVRTRSTLIKVGLLTGLMQFCAAWAFRFIMRPDTASGPLSPWAPVVVHHTAVALANGALSGFFVSGLLPAIERLFDITTDVRLLEWSDPNQPLLQKLLVDAPGTYHHSMLVGSLAGDAAESVGVNPLLARVGAYFHDVGKLRKPHYFGENLPTGAKNPHDDLTPSMSSLIITAHPKDGADMAEEYGVPREVRDIILESHGSSVVRYFWNKAQEQADGQTELEERDYRYRLPKPHSKEAAIVMLCDAVESAARSMDSPSVPQLRNLVRSIIMGRLHDGQLDESTLTITDLKRLEDTLVHGLTAVFHNRIRYPGQPDEDEAGQGEATGEEPAPQPAGEGATSGD